jgi:hypothetical protein
MTSMVKGLIIGLLFGIPSATVGALETQRILNCLIYMTKTYIFVNLFSSHFDKLYKKTKCQRLKRIFGHIV